MASYPNNRLQCKLELCLKKVPLCAMIVGDSINPTIHERENPWLNTSKLVLFVIVAKAYPFQDEPIDTSLVGIMGSGWRYSS